MSESWDIPLEQAEEIVQETAINNGWIDQEARENSHPQTLRALANVRAQLGNAGEMMARQIYSRKARFLLELIQNAEDCDYTRAEALGAEPFVKFEVYPTKIIFQCNEDGFTEANVISICSIGESSKAHQRGYIGEKGIGFKSVFQVASEVHIQSNWFSFYFKYDDGPNADKLGIITPIWEGDFVHPEDRPLTRMTLTLNHSQAHNWTELVNQFQEIPEDLLLFLSKTKAVEIRIHHPNERITLTRFKKIHDSEARITSLIRTVEDSMFPERNGTMETRYYITRRDLSGLPSHSARVGNNECEVVLALPLELVEGVLQPLISPQHVFAFLPIRKAGFNFLIQADFLLQASRQDVIDCPRNKEIVKGVAATFCDAVCQLCDVESALRYEWMRFLPAGQTLDTFWESFPDEITRLLSREEILFPHANDVPRRPNNLRILDASHLDRSGQPLFEDRPGVNMRYLSLRYDPEDIHILRHAFKLRGISDHDLFCRIKQDLLSGQSKMKNIATEDDWVTRASNLILTILRGSPVVADNIRTLSIIPLQDGQWVNALSAVHYFPATNGPEIPEDLTVTVHPEYIRNQSRKEMLCELGVMRCSPDMVIERLWNHYLTSEGASDLTLSKKHVRYLHWHHQDPDSRQYLRIWVYDNNGVRVNPRHRVMYFQSDDEYGPYQLLKAEDHPTDARRNIPAYPVPFLNSTYMEPYEPPTRPHRVAWIDWLEKALGVRRVLRLKFDGGALSNEFRHIIKYRPEKLVGVLKTHWNVFQDELNPAVVETLSRSEVTCLESQLKVLSCTYLPLQDLTINAQALGITQNFPFLKLPDTDNNNQNLRDWRFLGEFGVRFEAGLMFYVEILRQHEAKRRQIWDQDARENVLRTYELIADHYRENDVDYLREEFDRQELILDPCSFEPTATRPDWIDIDGCVWRGPVNLLPKKPLASVREYASRPNIVRLFSQILNIQDANWEDYLDELSNLQEQPSGALADMSNKILRLYEHLSRTSTSRDDWTQISIRFEDEALIYMPSSNTWFQPSQCLWESPVPIDGRALVSECYPDSLRDLFVDHLHISAASISTLVEELHVSVDRNPTVPRVKDMIWAINRMNPEQADLEVLLDSNFLPVRALRPDSGYELSLQSCRHEFAINDRSRLAELFNGHVSFLDFELEEVRQLEPFLRSLDLEDKYLSNVCGEETACSGNGLIDTRRTADFKERSYDLLRCAVFYRSPLETESLYQRLLATSILRTEDISTQYTLQLGNSTRIIRVPQGYIHVREHQSRWEIFVPQNRRHRDLCYTRQLPEALIKLFRISPSAREAIANILTKPLCILDDLLETEGIGNVRDIQPPPRPDLDEAETEGGFDEHETATVEVAQAPSRNYRAQSAPVMTAGTILSLEGSVRSIDLEGSEGSVSPVDTERSSLILTPRTNNFEGTPMQSPQYTPQSSNIGVPVSSQPRERLNFTPGRHVGIPDNVNPRDHGVHDAYRDLLEHVIRIAATVWDLPQSNLTGRAGAGLGNSQHHEGFEHAAAFGIRSQGQMNHDTKIGAAGELFIFEILSKFDLPRFGRHNWVSTIRHEVTVHPNYRDMDPWNGRETADITYTDNSGIFTSMLIEKGYLEEVWRGTAPEYFIEVKTTTGECGDRFFLSNSQFTRMQRLALTPGRTSPQVYIICRVFNLARNNLTVRLYVDPEAHRQRGDLVFESQTWTVRPRV